MLQHSHALLPRFALAAALLSVLVSCGSSPGTSDASDTSTQKSATTLPSATGNPAGTSVPAVGGSTAPVQIVYVTTRAIKAGEPGDDALGAGAIVAQPLQTGQTRPATALREADEFVGKLAMADIPEGTVVVSGMFVDPCRAEPCGSIPRASSK